MAACGSSGTTNPGNTGGTSAGGTSGGSTGGTGGEASGGSTGGTTNPGGGTTNPGGASGGNPQGGTTSGGGSGGTQASGGQGGGTGGSSSGGTGGTAVAGTGGGGTPMPANVLVTSANNAFWKTDTWTDGTSNANVTVNDTSTAQTWEGFGGAFNELGWKYLSTTEMQTKAVQLLFGDDGARFAWGRIPIGASDYAESRYTDDEVTSGSDTSMSSFSIERDKAKLIPYIKAAQSVKKNIRFWASPWTPPTWMKTGSFIAVNGSNKKTSSNYDSGDMKGDDETLKAFAQYLIKWVQAFQEQGIKVEIVAPQNEPNYMQNYPSCHWATDTFVKFVGQYFGPAIKAANLDLKIMDGTLSNPGPDADIGQKVLQDATAKSFIGAIGVQWGMAESNPVKALQNLAGGIPIWVSEHQCGGTTGSTAPAPNDYAYGQKSWELIRNAIKFGLTAYNAWNMVLDKGGLGIDDARKWPQNALLVADSGQVNTTPAYWVFRHVSQYVEPGAKVLATTGGDAVAFKNPDGSLVAIMYSGSANSKYTVAIGGKKLQFNMPSGWATLKIKP
jgi:glucosylceramidase